MMSVWKKSLACLALVTVIGCGPGDTSVEVQAPPAVEEIRLVLNEVVTSGNPLGSNGYTLEYNIEQLREADPAKADKLQKAYEELRGLNKANELKAKAKEMMEML